MKKPANAAEVVLAPGQVSFATCPTRLRTLLGSCVAFTFWHPQRRIGGMCHFMLPDVTIAVELVRTTFFFVLLLHHNSCPVKCAVSEPQATW